MKKSSRKNDRVRFCSTCGARIEVGEYISKAGNCLECALRGVFKERFGKDLLENPPR